MTSYDQSFENSLAENPQLETLVRELETADLNDDASKTKFMQALALLGVPDAEREGYFQALLAIIEAPEGQEELVAVQASRYLERALH